MNKNIETVLTNNEFEINHTTKEITREIWRN